MQGRFLHLVNVKQAMFSVSGRNLWASNTDRDAEVITTNAPIKTVSVNASFVF
jgi:hypothetical protein